MINVTPWEVLNDVWLVILSSSPWASFKIIIVGGIVYYFSKDQLNQNQLSFKTSDGGLVKIDSSAIMYCTSDGNYVNLHSSKGCYRVRVTLKSLQSKLGSSFSRIHKSTIINEQFIRELRHWRNGEYLLIMQDDKPLSSSKGYKAEIQLIKRKMVAQSPDPSLDRVHPSFS